MTLIKDISKIYFDIIKKHKGKVYNLTVMSSPTKRKTFYKLTFDEVIDKIYLIGTPRNNVLAHFEIYPADGCDTDILIIITGFSD